MADWKKVKKIDAHIHIIPDVVHEANPDSEDEWVYADQSKYLNLMKKYNIEQAIIMPLNDPYLMSMEFTVDAVNKNLKELVNKYLDKFYAMADIDISNNIENSKGNLIKAIVSNSNKVSFYKGVPVFRTSGSSGSFLCILLTKNGFKGSSGHYWSSEDILKHEWGHSIQQMTFGPIPYLINIGIPSAFIDNGDDASWEITANLIGGVDRNYNPDDIKQGRNYFWWW